MTMECPDSDSPTKLMWSNHFTRARILLILFSTLLMAKLPRLIEDIISSADLINTVAIQPVTLSGGQLQNQVRR